MGKTICTLVFLIFGLNAVTTRADLAGTWKGFNDAPTGLGPLELTFSHQGTEWKAACKFPEVDGDNTFPVRDLEVSDTNVSFIVGVESRLMRFRGKLAGVKIEGTYEMLRDGKSAYTGEWIVKRVQQTTGGASITPRTVQPADDNTSRQRPSVRRERKSVAQTPPPTGPFIVGRTTFYWKDLARLENLTDDPNDKRELMVTLWYPARQENDLARAAYFPSYELISGQSTAPLPASRKAHAFEKAPLARARQRFPVILFSHGLGENTTCYSAQLEELASYGYVVAAVDHSYDNQGTVFPGGHIVGWSNRWEWAFSEDGPDQQQFILTQLQVMVEDVSFVVDQLNRLNDEPSGMFTGKLDLGRLGFFGHSLGGAIAPLVCQADQRFKACLNQDGLLLGQVLLLDPAKGRPEQPFMFLGHGDPVTEETLQLMALTRTEYEEYDQRRQRRAFHALDMMPVESYVISVGGASHGSFTDTPLLSANTLPTYRARASTLRVIRDYTRAFFDKCLMNKKTKLLESTLTDYPEVTLARFGARVRR